MSDVQHPNPNAQGQPDRGAPTPPAAPASAPATTKTGRNISGGQILGGILLVLVIVFIAENTANVRIRIIVGPKVTTPVFVALLIAAVVGALISWLLRYRRAKNALRKQQAKEFKARQKR